MTEILWAVVVVVAILLLLAIVVRVVTGRRPGRGFETRDLPASYIAAYEARIAELQALFINQPREAVAGSKQLVDDMTMRMGYPTRLTDRERMTDLASVDHRHAARYKTGLELKPESTTEEMRRALQDHLELARELLAKGTPDPTAEVESRRQIAG
jgi:hypothetical protein